LDTPMLRLSRQIYHDAGHVAPLSGRKPKRHLIVSGDGGSTVYIGARASESFGRVYDKGVEQKACQPGLWWRWELELKGKTAYNHAGLLKSTDDHSVMLMAKVASWFRARTMHSYTSTVTELCVQNARDPTTVERRLRWLSHDVRPTVQALVDRVGRQRVLFALGLLPQSAVEPTVPPTITQECA
jgi:DNA relaxase NicK